MPALLKIVTRLLPLLCILSAPAAADAKARPAARAAACAALPTSFGRTGEILKMYRAFKGADGNSAIETIDLKGETKSFFNGTVTLTQFGLGDPTKAVIVHGSANAKIAPHPSPYREIFLILSGSSTIELANGTVYTLTPGSMLLSEDQDTPGRGGTAGPCGYVAVDFQFKPIVP